MKQFFDAAWETLSQEVKTAQKKDENISLNEDIKENVFVEFEDVYKNIKNKYMSEETDFLDRHKVIAVLIYLITKNDVIRYKGTLKEDEIFLGKELIITSVAFSIMFQMLQDKLNEKKCKLACDSYFMPIAMSCNTPYPLIFARNLRYCQDDGGINILELSEKLFLIETITLVKNNIDPRIIAEYETIS